MSWIGLQAKRSQFRSPCRPLTHRFTRYTTSESFSSTQGWPTGLGIFFWEFSTFPKNVVHSQHSLWGLRGVVLIFLTPIRRYTSVNTCASKLGPWSLYSSSGTLNLKKISHMHTVVAALWSGTAYTSGNLVKCSIATKTKRFPLFVVGKGWKTSFGWCHQTKTLVWLGCSLPCLFPSMLARPPVTVLI